MGENGVMGGGGMSPADMAAVLRGNNNYGYNDGWGGNCWWIVILFMAMFWGGNGFGWNNNNGFQNAIGYENLATSNEVQRGFDNQNSLANEREILASINANSLQGMQNANQNTQYITGALNDKYNELQRDIAGVGMMQQNKIEALQQKVQGLELQNAVAGVVRYPMSTAYNAGFNPFCNCGNNGCCM